MKVVGLRDAREIKRKRDGQPMNAWMLFYTAPADGTIGEEAQMQFVDAKMFADALNEAGCMSPGDLVGRECDMLWNRRGFLDALVVRPLKKSASA